MQSDSLFALLHEVDNESHNSRYNQDAAHSGETNDQRPLIVEWNPVISVVVANVHQIDSIVLAREADQTASK